MSLAGPPKMNKIGAMADDEFTLSWTVEEIDSLGVPKDGTATTVPNVPGNLQPMSTSRQDQYRSVGEGTLWDLYLPEYFGGSQIVLNPNDDAIASDGTVYRCIGQTMRQGSSGRLLVPVQRRAR